MGESTREEQVFWKEWADDLREGQGRCYSPPCDRNSPVAVVQLADAALEPVDFDD